MIKDISESKLYFDIYEMVECYMYLKTKNTKKKKTKKVVFVKRKQLRFCFLTVFKRGLLNGLEFMEEGCYR